MLNVALVGLLAGSLAIGGGDNKNPQSGDKPTADVSVPGIFTQSVLAPPAVSPETIQDTYAFGIAARQSPIRFWANYAQGEAESYWNTAGETPSPQTDITIAGSQGVLVARRANFGAELGLPVGLFGFGLGVGGQLTLAQNKFDVQTVGPAGLQSIRSDFGLQGAKVYGSASAGPISLHGGYLFDLGTEREFTEPIPALGGARLPTTLSTSDGRDAIFFGADFDYPSPRIRLFGGLDYYMLQGIEDNTNTAFNESTEDGDDIMNAILGAGVRLSIFEIGAALQIQTRLSNPIVADIGTVRGVGSHAATVAPYLRISPPQIPASIFVKGAVQEEYTEFGYALGGANSPKPAIGFTAGLTVGFE